MKAQEVFSHLDFSDSDVSDQDVSPLTFWTRRFAPDILNLNVLPPDILDQEVSTPDI